MPGQQSGVAARGGSVTIGSVVSGGTPNRILFIDHLGALAVASAMQFDDGTNRATFAALTSTSDVRFTASASAATPGLCLAGDPDTGLDSLGANTLLASLGGVAALELGGTTPDSDQTMVMGRCRLDSRNTDTATFSHRDMTAVGQLAVQQTAAGVTNLNSVGTLNIANSGANTWGFSATSLSPLNADNTRDFGATASRIRRLFMAEYLEISEMAAPAAPGADKARFFCRDTGGGKSQICAIFPTGAIQVIATEP
jgi:hypothetical protein